MNIYQIWFYRALYLLMIVSGLVIMLTSSAPNYILCVVIMGLGVAGLLGLIYKDRKETTTKTWLTAAILAMLIIIVLFMEFLHT